MVQEWPQGKVQKHSSVSLFSDTKTNICKYTQRKPKHWIQRNNEVNTDGILCYHQISNYISHIQTVTIKLA